MKKPRREQVTHACPPQEGYTCTPHAAVRYAQRVLGIPRPKATDVWAAAVSVVDAIATAKVSHRYRDKTRVMITADGVHLIVVAGGVVVTVLAPGQIVSKCPCTRCLQARMERNRRSKGSRS